MTQAAVTTRHEFETGLVRKAWEDAAFRVELIADPASAIANYAGVPAATLPRIVVHEEAAGQWTIVLPAKPAEAAELSALELEQVSGGTYDKERYETARKSLGILSFLLPSHDRPPAWWTDRKP